MIEQAKQTAQRLRDYDGIKDHDCVYAGVEVIDALVAEVERLTKVDVEPVACVCKDRAYCNHECNTKTSPVAWRFQDPKDGHWLYTTHITDLSKKFWRLKNEVFDPLYPASALAALQAENENLRYKSDYWKQMHDEIKAATISETQSLRAQLAEAQEKMVEYNCNIAKEMEKLIEERDAAQAEKEMVIKTNVALLREIAALKGDVPDHKVEGSLAEFDRYIAGDR